MNKIADLIKGMFVLVIILCLIATVIYFLLGKEDKQNTQVFNTNTLTSLFNKKLNLQIDDFNSFVLMTKGNVHCASSANSSNETTCALKGLEIYATDDDNITSLVAKADNVSIQTSTLPLEYNSFLNNANPVTLSISVDNFSFENIFIDTLLNTPSNVTKKDYDLLKTYIYPQFKNINIKSLFGFKNNKENSSIASSFFFDNQFIAINHNISFDIKYYNQGQVDNLLYTIVDKIMHLSNLQYSSDENALDNPVFDFLSSQSTSRLLNKMLNQGGLIFLKHNDLSYKIKGDNNSIMTPLYAFYQIKMNHLDKDDKRLLNSDFLDYNEKHLMQFPSFKDKLTKLSKISIHEHIADLSSVFHFALHSIFSSSKDFCISITPKSDNTPLNILYPLLGINGEMLFDEFKNLYNTKERNCL